MIAARITPWSAVAGVALAALAAPVLAAQLVEARVDARVDAISQPAPFAHGERTIGKTLVDRDCVACHARRMAGDADKMYLRSDRRVNTPQQLLAQVSYCNSELGTKYFPDEEEHIAAYLNAHYYKFKP